MYTTHVLEIPVENTVPVIMTGENAGVNVLTITKENHMVSGVNILTVAKKNHVVIGVNIFTDAKESHVQRGVNILTVAKKLIW